MLALFKNVKPIRTINEFTIDEIYDTFNKVCAIYKENANIISSFCKKNYLNEDMKYIHYYHLINKNEFKPQIVILKTARAVYLLDKTAKIFHPYDILRDINNFGTEKEKRACEILTKLVPLIQTYPIKFNNYKSDINLNVNFSSENSHIWIEHYPGENILNNRKFRKYIEEDAITIVDNANLCNLENNPFVYIGKPKEYQKLLQIISSYYNNKNEDDFLFASNNTILDKFKNTSLEEYDLSLVDFDNKNISGLDISHNSEVHINFDKIVKDVSNCNFNGYDLRKIVFKNFDIQNTNFTNTGAIIDIATCTINKESKMNLGTLFDEDNKFVFIDKKLTLNQAKDLGIKIKKLEQN